MMNFTFEESCIINEVLEIANKEIFLDELKDLINNTEDEDIVIILKDLKGKVINMTDEEVIKLFNMLPLEEFSFSEEVDI